MSGTIHSNAQSSPIDLDHLERQTLGDRALQREVLELFSQQMAAARAQIESSSGEVRALLAHRIKGAASGVGAHSVATCAATLEGNPERDDIAAMLLERMAEAGQFIIAMQAG